MFQLKTPVFSTVFRVQHLSEEPVGGVRTKTYTDAIPAVRQGAFTAFHGRELNETNREQYREGGTITTWYYSDIVRTDRILLNDDTAQVYEVVDVENAENRNMYMVITVDRIVNT